MFGCVILAGARLLRVAAGAESPIIFRYEPVSFRLENSETPERHAPETMAGGVAVFDYNNDGKLDIFFTNGADIRTLKKDSPKYSNRLFANDGRGRFTEVTARAGLAGNGYDTGVAIGDFDNDGCEDIFVGGVHRNTLYHNNCDGTFTNVTKGAGVESRPDPEFGPLWSVGAAWADVNNDGLLDLFVVNYLAWTSLPSHPAITKAGASIAIRSSIRRRPTNCSSTRATESSRTGHRNPGCACTPAKAWG